MGDNTFLEATGNEQEASNEVVLVGNCDNQGDKRMMSIMRKLTSVALGLSGLIANGFGLAREDSSFLAAKNFSNTLYHTTDYVFRGVSFADEDPQFRAASTIGTQVDFTRMCGDLIGTASAPRARIRSGLVPRLCQ
jgi:hypothetical protein